MLQEFRSRISAAIYGKGMVPYLDRQLLFFQCTLPPKPIATVTQERSQLGYPGSSTRVLSTWLSFAAALKSRAPCPSSGPQSLTACVRWRKLPKNKTPQKRRTQTLRCGSRAAKPTWHLHLAASSLMSLLKLQEPRDWRRNWLALQAKSHGCPCRHQHTRALAREPGFPPLSKRNPLVALTS